MRGRRERLQMQVSEADPGRVLAETNLDTGVVTVFTVVPGDDESPTLVRIFSQWETGGGLREVMDR
jgi:hypothetical protein